MKLLSLLGAFAMLSAAQPVHAQNAAANLPAGDGRDILATTCTQCHGLNTIMVIRDGAGGWRAFIDYMIMKGAQLTEPETDTLVRYMAANFGPNSPPAAGYQPVAVNLPAGNGKDLVEARCVVCHDLTRVAGAKRGKSEWEGIVNQMVNRGAVATPEEKQTIVAYLASQFGNP
jgi:cytochrome c5